MTTFWFSLEVVRREDVRAVVIRSCCFSHAAQELLEVVEDPDDYPEVAATVINDDSISERTMVGRLLSELELGSLVRVTGGRLDS